MSIKTKTKAKAGTKAKSLIFEAVQETAVDLHLLGFIDQRKRAKFDRLCQDQPPPSADKSLSNK